MGKRLFARFFEEDTAAIAVDWTVVTAACVGLGLSSVVAVRNASVPLGQSLSDASVVALNFSGEQAEPFTYVPFHLRPDQIEDYIARYSDPLSSGSDDYLNGLHMSWSDILMTAFANGDEDTARRYLDGLYTVDEGLRARGLTPPGDTSIEDYVNMFNQTFP